MTPEQLRKKVLADGQEFIEAYMSVAMGRGVMACTDKKMRDEVWDLFKSIMLKADDPSKLKGLGEGTISEQVDKVLLAVAEGDLTVQQGKRLIEMLQAGFEIKELPGLLKQLADAGIEPK